MWQINNKYIYIYSYLFIYLTSMESPKYPTQNPGIGLVLSLPKITFNLTPNIPIKDTADCSQLN